ncbi:YaiI/YqxD family protein [Lichenicoccus sp.]|uniref:YaiI/YqxD family protein n=1 Tax=Lichenicoccus sp. TaxID=2781899 RepID=UPI003D0FF451
MASDQPPGQATRIFVDADACPVKDEVYRVATRYGVRVYVVSNSMMNVPASPLVERVVVESGPDVADGWIAERAGARDVVVTSDVPLAARCVRAGAAVLAPTGKLFDETAIGLALATRNLMDDLRSAGQVTGGPRPFSAKDRSAFLSALDVAITRARRGPRPRLNLARPV